MDKKRRFQQQIVFWLNLNDPEEETISDYVDDLKSQRTFAKTVRDGLRLVRDLRAGNVDVLCELFPFVQAKLAPQAPPDVDGLRRQIEKLQDAVLGGIQSPYQQAPVGGLRPITPIGGGALNVPMFAAPKYDEDDGDLLVLAKDMNTNSAQNFLDSVMRLQH